MHENFYKTECSFLCNIYKEKQHTIQSKCCISKLLRIENIFREIFHLIYV